MHDEDFTWYVKQITKLNYDERYALAAEMYDRVETVWGAAERRRVGLAVWELC